MEKALYSMSRVVILISLLLDCAGVESELEGYDGGMYYIRYGSPFEYTCPVLSSYLMNPIFIDFNFAKRLVRMSTNI